MKLLLILLSFTTVLFAKTGYLQQTIKSTNNTICIYKYSNSLYAINIGIKSTCKQSMNLDLTIKRK